MNSKNLNRRITGGIVEDDDHGSGYDYNDDNDDDVDEGEGEDAFIKLLLDFFCQQEEDEDQGVDGNDTPKADVTEGSCVVYLSFDCTVRTPDPIYVLLLKTPLVLRVHKETT